MKAVMRTEYGTPDVLYLTEMEKPSPKDNEVLVRVHANSLNFGDLFARDFGKITPRTFTMPSPLWIISRILMGVRKPRVKILGNEFSGVVESVGNAVTKFKAGDAVFGYLGQSMGANAEYITVAENALIEPMPSNLSFEEAACLPYGAITAAALLHAADIQPGQKVLINGASGGIGSAALQLAKHYGAEVTGVCGTQRVEMVKALGADHVIDYKHEDFTQNGETYDLIFDVMNKLSFQRCKNSLTEQGIYLLASFKIPQLLQMLRTSRGSGKKVICALSADSADDLRRGKELAESGALKVIVDRCFPLEQTAEAHRYAESGQKRGSVAITMLAANATEAYDEKSA